MLTPKEKSRIRHEEMVRRKFQNELSQGKSKESRFWIFINSAIFLWFLSTIAISGITATWTYFHNRAVENHARQQKTAQLDLEIEGRISQFLVNVEPMVKKPYDCVYSLESPYSVNDVRK